MSVKKIDRELSKMQFVATSIEIFKEVMNYVTFLSNRRWRSTGDRAASLAGLVMEEVNRANGIFPSNDQSAYMRLQHLYEAAGALNALDVFLTLCFEAIFQNPEGAFITKDDKKVDTNKCKEKIEKISARLGSLIVAETLLLQGQIDKYSKPSQT